MASTTFHEATQGTYAGYATAFSLEEANCLAALCGGVIVEATAGVVGKEFCGNGWWQISSIQFVDGKLRLPSCVSNKTHRILRLVWNPVSGCLGAVCQTTDAKGRLLNGHGRLLRDADGQTVRAKGSALEFVDGNWRQCGPIDSDAVGAEWVRRTQS